MYEDCFSEYMKQDIKDRLNRLINDERYKEDAGFLGWIRDFVFGIWEMESDKFDFRRFLIDLKSKDSKEETEAIRRRFVERDSTVTIESIGDDEIFLNLRDMTLKKITDELIFCELSGEVTGFSISTAWFRDKEG